MSCAILLLTHPGIGSALLSVAERLLGALPLHCQSIDVGYHENPDTLVPSALALMQGMDGGDGVLLLTDLYGASPSNLASLLQQQHRHCRRVSGVNLPMLLRVMNYPDQALDRLTEIAADAARNGALVDNA
jgi:PTS system mannose-specific IIA component